MKDCKRSPGLTNNWKGKSGGTRGQEEDAMSFVNGKRNPLEGTVSGKTAEPPDKSLFGPKVPREPQQTGKPAAG